MWYDTLWHQHWLAEKQRSLASLLVGSWRYLQYNHTHQWCYGALTHPMYKVVQTMYPTKINVIILNKKGRLAWSRVHSVSVGLDLRAQVMMYWISNIREMVLKPTSCPLSLHSCATCWGFKHMNSQVRVKPSPAGSTLSFPKILTIGPLQWPTAQTVKEDIT